MIKLQRSRRKSRCGVIRFKRKVALEHKRRRVRRIGDGSPGFNCTRRGGKRPPGPGIFGGVLRSWRILMSGRETHAAATRGARAPGEEKGKGSKLNTEGR